MLDLRDFNQFAEYIPDLWFNDGKEVSVQLKCATIPNIQKEIRDQVGINPDKVADMNHSFIAKHVGEIKGLSVGGVPIKSFDDLLERGPSELYSWISTVVYSSQRLDRAEIKN